MAGVEQVIDHIRQIAALMNKTKKAKVTANGTNEWIVVFVFATVGWIAGLIAGLRNHQTKIFMQVGGLSGVLVGLLVFRLWRWIRSMRGKRTPVK